MIVKLRLMILNCLLVQLYTVNGARVRNQQHIQVNDICRLTTSKIIFCRLDLGEHIYTDGVANSNRGEEKR